VPELSAPISPRKSSHNCSCGAADDDGMVACDACDRWFHFACVNLSPEDAELMNSFTCAACVASK
jgi:hypothetical protein